MAGKNVTEAMASRYSCRSYKDLPVDLTIVKDCLAKALQSPSGGNLQPWHFYILVGDKLAAFTTHIQSYIGQKPQGDDGAYDIYPPSLKEPYRTRRFDVGEALYGAMGIPRDNKMGRLAWLMENYRFFGAPLGLFCMVDRNMGPPQWADLGMVLQSLMLLLNEAGLDSCAQEAWSRYHQAVESYLDTPENLMLFCGMAIGYGDTDASANGFRSSRASLEDTTTILGDD